MRLRVCGGAGGKVRGTGDGETAARRLSWTSTCNSNGKSAHGNGGILTAFRVPVTAWHFARKCKSWTTRSSDTRSKKELAGACYDLYAPSKDATKPVGEWNQMRILVKGAHVEHWIKNDG